MIGQFQKVKMRAIEYLNKKVIEGLNNNDPPWLRKNTICGFPINVAYKEPYSAFNFLLLNTSAKQNNFTSKWWGTATEFKTLGAKVFDKPTQVLYGKSGIYEPLLVYNLDQTDFLNRDWFPEVTTDYDSIENIIKNCQVKVEFINNLTEAAYYYPPKDCIEVPSKESFVNLSGFYETYIHELIHWTELRLGWHDFDLYQIPARELRAEIGSALLMTEFGVPHYSSNENVEKFILEWIELINDDPYIMFEVTQAASTAVNYLLENHGVL